MQETFKIYGLNEKEEVSETFRCERSSFSPIQSYIDQNGKHPTTSSWSESSDSLLCSILFAATTSKNASHKRLCSQFRTCILAQPEI